MSDLRALLLEHGLRPKRMNPGAQSRLRCPQCEAKDEDSFSLKIDADGQGFTGNCHRGSCGHTIGARVHDAATPAARPQKERCYVPPKPIPAEAAKPAMDVYAWFAARGIDEDTVDAFGVFIKPDHKFGKIGISDAVVFPYKYRGEVVNRKYRGVKEKKFMAQEFKALPTLFNVDGIEDFDCVWWVEGEPDVMAMWQAGYTQTVSLKDGSPGKLRDEDDPERQEDKRFDALETHEELLGKVKKFVLAGDSDAAGGRLHEELARRLGRHRCWRVTWPEGCKDANDTLKAHGVSGMQEALEAAQPWPIDGVQEIDVDRMVAYRRLPPPPTMRSGMAAANNIINWPADGRVIVITGIPNSGKSQFVMNIMAYTMRYENRKWFVFSPEMEPFDEFVMQMVEILSGAMVRPNRSAPAGYEVLNDESYRAWLVWLKHRMIGHCTDAEIEPPSMDQMLERGRGAVLRYGVTDLCIDPFNELELSAGNLSETQYIGRCLQRARAFGRRHGCNVWIVAHPNKLQKPKDGAPIEAPGPYDIAGSAHWANKPDVGITIHTPRDLTSVRVWKARHWRYGRKGSACEIQYDKFTGRYLDIPDPNVQSQFKRMSWREPED